MCLSTVSCFTCGHYFRAPSLQPCDHPEHRTCKVTDVMVRRNAKCSACCPEHENGTNPKEHGADHSLGDYNCSAHSSNSTKTSKTEIDTYFLNSVSQNKRLGWIYIQCEFDRIEASCKAIKRTIHCMQNRQAIGAPTLSDSQIMRKAVNEELAYAKDKMSSGGKAELVKVDSSATSTERGNSTLSSSSTATSASVEDTQIHIGSRTNGSSRRRSRSTGRFFRHSQLARGLSLDAEPISQQTVSPESSGVDTQSFAPGPSARKSGTLFYSPKDSNRTYDSQPYSKTKTESEITDRQSRISPFRSHSISCHYPGCQKTSPAQSGVIIEQSQDGALYKNGKKRTVSPSTPERASKSPDERHQVRTNSPARNLFYSSMSMFHRAPSYNSISSCDSNVSFRMATRKTIEIVKRKLEQERMEAMGHFEEGALGCGMKEVFPSWEQLRSGC